MALLYQDYQIYLFLPLSTLIPLSFFAPLPQLPPTLPCRPSAPFPKQPSQLEVEEGGYSNHQRKERKKQSIELRALKGLQNHKARFLFLSWLCDLHVCLCVCVPHFPFLLFFCVIFLFASFPVCFFRSSPVILHQCRNDSFSLSLLLLSFGFNPGVCVCDLLFSFSVLYFCYFHLCLCACETTSCHNISSLFLLSFPEKYIYISLFFSLINCFGCKETFFSKTVPQYLVSSVLSIFLHFPASPPLPPIPWPHLSL